MTQHKQTIDEHNAQQKSYYDQSLPRKKRMQPINSTYVNRHIERVIEVGQLQQQECILDLGCGAGKFTIPLAQRGFDVDGLDLSEYLLESVADYNADDLAIDLHCYDVLDQPPELAQQYDVIVGFFVLHHLADLQASFHAMKHYLKPKGRIIFLEPNAYNPLFYLQITFSRNISWQGEKGFLNMRGGYLSTLCSEAGFGDFTLHRYGMLPPFIINTRLGPPVEDAVDKLPLINPLRAFQILVAELP